MTRAPAREMRRRPRSSKAASRAGRSAWAVGIAVASFAAFLLLLAYGRDLEGPPAPGPTPSATAPSATAAWPSCCAAMGLGGVSRQAPAGRGVGPGHPLVVAEPDAGRAEAPTACRALWRGGAGPQGAAWSVVLPKWLPGEARKNRPDWLEGVELMPRPGRWEPTLGAAGRSGPRRRGSRGGCAGARGCRADWGGRPRGRRGWSSKAPSSSCRGRPRLEPVVSAREGSCAPGRPRPTGRRWC